MKPWHSLEEKTIWVVGPTLFLLTDSASFVTGHSLMVDGGWTTW